jgi:thiamine biosynthesis lipoprotein
MRFLVLIFALFLAACGKEPLVQTQSYVFGTLVDISIYGETEDKAHAISTQILQDFGRLHHQYHAWEADSELGKLNQHFANHSFADKSFAAAKASVESKNSVKSKTPFESQALVQSQALLEISPELAQMLIQAQVLSKQSQGLFNPAIGGLIHAWGFQRDEFTPVEINDALIQKLVQANPQMSDIVVKNNRAYSTKPSVKLDLGGYAKGYALDRALALLQKQGVKNALVNIGGNIIALGQHGEKPWRVGIQHPRQPKPMATIDLPSGWAVGTSGDYQRYFEQGGKRYCHIIDPRTGYPAQGVQSVTVLLPPSPVAGVLSDVASKPIFLSAANQRANAAKAMGVAHYLLIDAQGNVSMSAAMKQRVHWLSQPAQMPANQSLQQLTAPLKSLSHYWVML